MDSLVGSGYDFGGSGQHFGFSISTEFFKHNFVSSHMYPENPEGTQVIVGSMKLGYISDTARNRTRNLFRPKREPISLGHSDGSWFLNHNESSNTTFQIDSFSTIFNLYRLIIK